MVLALAKEIEMRKSEFQNEVVETIYFGGGTPSTLQISDLRFLIEEVYKHYKVVENPEITVENGRIKQQNLDSYPLLKLASTPRIETVLVPTYDFWGGVGEPTICVVGPAVANAVSAAIGRPVRNFPLYKEGLSLA